MSGFLASESQKGQHSSLLLLMSTVGCSLYRKVLSEWKKHWCLYQWTKNLVQGNLHAYLVDYLMTEYILQDFWKIQESKGMRVFSNNPDESLERLTMLSFLTPKLPASTTLRKKAINAHIALVRMDMKRESHDDAIEHIGSVAEYFNVHSYRDEVSVANF